MLSHISGRKVRGRRYGAPIFMGSIYLTSQPQSVAVAQREKPQSIGVKKVKYIVPIFIGSGRNRRGFEEAATARLAGVVEEDLPGAGGFAPDERKNAVVFSGFAFGGALEMEAAGDDGELRLAAGTRE